MYLSRATHASGQAESLGRGCQSLLYFLIILLARPFGLNTYADDVIPKQSLLGAVRLDKATVRPNETNIAVVNASLGTNPNGARLEVQIETPFASMVDSFQQACRSGENRLTIPPLNEDGGYIVRIRLLQSGRPVAEDHLILSVASNVADDLRYGFYANYTDAPHDDDAKAAMFARFHVNAVEFYDYFPAHGRYAPNEPEYRTEPFGIQIDARDVQRKIEADRRHGILSVAYVAAYAASESIYRKYPYPMTDDKGIPKVFNGQIMSEQEADREGKPKWFWLMNIADDSPWHAYVTGELRRALKGPPDSLVSFDGFEIDTYGDDPNTKFYAQGSSRNGDLLRDVLHDYVRDVHSLTHDTKPEGLVSFNSVDEFGVRQMYDVTDFLFLEIWRSYKQHLGDLVDLCFRHREARRQRVILKLYPADMSPSRNSWPPAALARVLGAAMTGGGSLMVAGEPNEASNEMHGLNTLYYPDHCALSKNDEEILRSYYDQDALLFGYTHGPEVYNSTVQVPLPNCITKTYAAPRKHAFVVQLLNVGKDPDWSADMPSMVLLNQTLAFNLPEGVTPTTVYFVTPDASNYRLPVKLEFSLVAGKFTTRIPELRVHGTLILQY